MNKAFVPVILYLVLFAYFYSFSAYGFNIWDEGSYAYGALRTYNGQTPMEDFNPRGYLPGRYYYGAFFFKLFGVHIQSLRLGTVLFTPAMVLMVYAVARKIMPRGFAFLAALAVLSAPSMYYSRFYPFFCVLLLYGLIEYTESRRAPWFFFLLAGTIVCFFFKPEVALFSAVISAAVFASPFSRSARRPQESAPPGGVPRAMVWGVILSSAGIAAALSVYAVRHGIPEKFFNLLWESHRVWGNPFPEILPFFKLLAESGPHLMFERVLFYLPVLVYFAVTGVLIVRLARLGWEKTSLHLLIILSFGVCSFGLVVWRAGFDNLLRTLPPFYILFCYLLSLVWARLAGRLPAAGQGGAAAKRIALNVLTVFLPFLFYYEMNVHHGFYAGSVGAVSHETALLRLNRVEVYTHPVEAAWLKQLVARIRFFSRPGEPILALPLNPVFYFLTDRVNPTRHDWILPGMLDAGEQKKVVEQLTATPPKLILLADIAIDAREERRFSNYAPIIFDFIAKNYRRAEVIGFFQVLLPRSAGETALPPAQRF